MKTAVFWIHIKLCAALVYAINWCPFCEPHCHRSFCRLLHLDALLSDHLCDHIKQWHVAMVTNRVWSVVEVFIKAYA